MRRGFLRHRVGLGGPLRMGSETEEQRVFDVERGSGWPVGWFVLWGGSLTGLGFLVGSSGMNAFRGGEIVLGLAAVVPGVLGAVAASSTFPLGFAGAALGQFEAPALFVTLAVSAAVLGRLASGSLSISEGVSKSLAAQAIAVHPRLLETRATSELARARRHGHSLTLVTLRIGPIHAEAVREAALDVARRLKRRLRITDYVGIDGSRVLVLLPETPAEAVEAIRKRITPVLHELPTVEAQVGAASFPMQEVTWVGLLARAVTSERPLSPAGVLEARDLAGGALGEGSYV